MKFRKKPVVVEAILYRGAGIEGNLSEALSFTGKDASWDEYFDSFESYEEYVLNDRQAFKIFTLEGTMEAMPGDWIIRGVKGEHYPCKADIFQETYEPEI